MSDPVTCFRQIAATVSANTVVLSFALHINPPPSIACQTSASSISPRVSRSDLMSIFSATSLGLDANAITTRSSWTFAGILVIGVLSRWLFNVKLDDNEPPALRPRVPVIGHLVGLMTQGTDFFLNLSL